MREVLLIGHAGAGMASLVMCVAATVAIFKERGDTYVFFMRAIGGLVVASVVSGVALVVFLATQQAVYSFCVRMAFYLAVVGSVEWGLYFRIGRGLKLGRYGES